MGVPCPNNSYHASEMPKPLTGDEATILALFAQARHIWNKGHLTRSQRRWLWRQLSPRAKEIGHAIFGRPASKSAMRTAAAFNKWADSLGKTSYQPPPNSISQPSLFSPRWF
jgi:hypothetical protein